MPTWLIITKFLPNIVYKNIVHTDTGPDCDLNVNIVTGI